MASPWAAQERRYAYDAFNHLVKASLDGAKHDHDDDCDSDEQESGWPLKELFSYDALERQVIRETLGRGERDEKVATIYDGLDAFQELLMEQGRGPREPREVREYVRAGGMVLARLIARVNRRHDEGKSLFFQGDQLNSTTLLSDPRDRVVNQIRYDAFGAPLGAANPGEAEHKTTAYLFNGKRLDEIPGTYHYHAREYRPDLGQFLSRDPLTGLPGQPATWNSYAYAANDPIGSLEILGMYSWKKFKNDAKSVGKATVNTAVAVVGGSAALGFIAVPSTFFALRDLGPLVFEGNWKPIVGDIITPYVSLGYGTYRASQGGEWWGADFVKGEFEGFDKMNPWLEDPENKEPGDWWIPFEQWVSKKSNGITQKARDIQNQAQAVQQEAVEDRNRLEANMFCSSQDNQKIVLKRPLTNYQTDFNDCVQKRMADQRQAQGSRAPGRTVVGGSGK